MANNWILLRGLARGVGHWGDFVERLQRKYPEDHIELLDIPGNGERYHEVSPLKISSYVKDLRERSELVQEKKKFNILALSLGGMIASEWMFSYPFEVSKAYIVCSSSSAHSHFYERLRWQNAFKILPLIFSQEQSEKWERTILGMISNSPERQKAVLSGFTEYARQNPVKASNIIRQLVAASQYRFPKRAPGDVVLIGSWGDQLVSPQCTLSLARAWQVEPKMHPWSGHDIPIDDPQWLLEQLL